MSAATQSSGGVRTNRTHIVSFSELDAVRQCKFKHHLSYRERWRPETDALALSRGKVFHSVLENHYLKIKAAQQTDADTYPDPFAVIEQSDLEDDQLDLLKWMYEGYLERYGLDPEWEILAVEQKIEERLAPRSSFVLKGFVDLVVRDHSAGGGVFLIDHKTCRNLPKQRELDFDDQMGIYTWLLKKQWINVRGAQYSACRSNKLKRPMSLDERFQRSLTTRTDTELEVMAQEALTTFRSAYGVGQRGKAEGALPPRSPNPDTCGWRCPFVEPCLMSRKGRNIHELLPEMGFTQQHKRH